MSTYWMFKVLIRLIESKSHRSAFRHIVLSNNLFVVTVLSMFDEDPQVRAICYLHCCFGMFLIDRSCRVQYYIRHKRS